MATNIVGGTFLFGQVAGSANREDLIDLITLLDPYETPFFSMVSKGTALHKTHEWLTETLAATATGGGTIYAEGASFNAANITDRTRLVNICEIFRKDVQVSNTQRAVRPAGVKDEYLHQVQLAIKEIGRDLEATLLQGAAGSATGSCSAGSTMKTLRNFITTNTFATSSTAIGCTGIGFSATAWALGEHMFNSTLERVFLQGGRVDTVLCNGATKRQISAFGGWSGGAIGVKKVNETASSKRLTASVDTYDSDFGVVNVILDRWVGTEESGSGLGTALSSTGLNRAFFLQLDSWEFSVLRPLKHVPLPPGGDAVRGMVLLEGTLTAYAERWNAMISGIATKLTPTSDGTRTA